jgi:hypothetical protein
MADTPTRIPGNPTLSEYGHTPQMEALMSETPVFVDTLAATARWGRPDAAAHFIELQDLTDLHQVEAFIENYGAAA